MHQTSTLDWAIGDYVMESVIRAGGRSTVYAARKQGESELRALKLVAIGTDPGARAIADAERRGAELQQEFARHHGLVPWVEAIGEARSCLYVAMEYVPGEDLFDALGRGPLTEARALEIAIALATFLEKTHRFDVPGRAPERIIHADLKPGNVRLRPDGRICVLDFGIAKAMAERRMETTQKWGTRQYMSPEWLHSGTIDEQVDYWSLGILLYEMLTGYRPFRRFEQHENVLEDAIRRRELPEPLPPEIGPAPRHVVSRLLAPTTAQRYPNAGAIRAALTACQQDVPALTPQGNGAMVHVGAPPPLVDSPPTEPYFARTRTDDDFRLGAGHPILEVPATGVDSPPTEPCFSRDEPGGPIRSGVGEGALVVSAAVRDSPATEPRPAIQVLGPPAGRGGEGLAGMRPPAYAMGTATAAVASAAASIVAAAKAPRKSWRRLLVALFWMILAAILASEGIGCVAAERLRSDAAVADERELDAALTRRAQLAGWTFFDAALHLRADPVLKDRLVSLADVVISDYRQEQPTVGRPEWQQAQGWLIHAVALYPDDARLRSKLRYTEGQLQRLNGARRAEGGQVKAARQSYHTAVQKFREAASLDSSSPDPYLGLAHAYVYGLGDVDNAVESINAAEKRGYRLKRRERAQLGDGYRARGERLWRSARDLDGDQQRDAYQRAEQDFKRCVEYFTPIVEFASSADHLRRCEARLTEIDERSGDDTPWWQRIFGGGRRDLERGIADAIRGLEGSGANESDSGRAAGSAPGDARGRSRVGEPRPVAPALPVPPRLSGTSPPRAQSGPGSLLR